MRTLDEVIKAIEYNTSGLPKGAMNCLFCNKPDCGVRNDALHYLKEYRKHLVQESDELCQKIYELKTNMKLDALLQEKPWEKRK